MSMDIRQAPTEQQFSSVSFNSQSQSSGRAMGMQGDSQPDFRQPNDLQQNSVRMYGPDGEDCGGAGHHSHHHHMDAMKSNQPDDNADQTDAQQAGGAGQSNDPMAQMMQMLGQMIGQVLGQALSAATSGMGQALPALAGAGGGGSTPGQA